ncbi:MAG: chloride channel protein [Acidobacteriota bacterium]
MEESIQRGKSRRSGGPGRLWTRLLTLGGHPLETRRALREGEGRFLRHVLLALLLGTSTGFLVAAFDFLLKDQAVWYLYALRSPLAYVLLPPAGLLLSVFVVRNLVPSREGHLTEDYILLYHAEDRSMRLANLPGKMLAAFATIACGGSLGLEGPSIYLGSNLGDSLQQRLSEFFGREDRRLLLVAGAAAGMAAIFKAPLTGLIFAMEAPYKSRMATRALVPAMVASSASYLTFASFAGSEPLFAVEPGRAAGLAELGLSLLLGLAAGLTARFFVALAGWVERWIGLLPGGPYGRAAAAGLAVGLLGAAVFAASGEPFIYGPGYRLIQHVLQSPVPLDLLLLFLGVKMAATAFTLAGGGVGGIFFPMAIMGILLGELFARLTPAPPPAFYPLLGAAAFLAAGYRTPLAAVAFVAETTGNPWVLIPAMLAAVAAFLAMGQRGISKNQKG